MSRYNESLNANLRYRVGAWTMLRAAYAETLETGQERVLRNLSFISEDPETSLLIDTRTGLPFEASPEITSLNSQTTRTERFTAELTFSRDRNVIGISGGIEDQDDQVSDNDEEHEFAGVFWQRQLNRRTSARLSGNYERTTFKDENRGDKKYVANGLISRDIRRNFEVFASYTFSKQVSTDAADEYKENRATVGLRITR